MNEPFAQKNESNLLIGSFFGERTERFAHLLIFGEQPDWFAHIAHYWWANEGIARFLKKVPKNMILVTYFWASRSFVKLKSKWAICSKKRANRSKKRAICSFIMIDLSQLLTVAHLSWVTWAIRSQLLICSEQSERIAHSRSFDVIEWANERMSDEQIPNPVFTWSKRKMQDPEPGLH